MSDRKSVYRELEFRNFLSEVKRNEKFQRLRRFRVEFEKMLNIYVKSCHQEKRLVLQIKKLKQEISGKYNHTMTLKRKIEKSQKEYQGLQLDLESTQHEFRRCSKVLSTKSNQILDFEKELEEEKDRIKEGNGLNEKSDLRIKELAYEREQLTHRKSQKQMNCENIKKSHDHHEESIDDLALKRDAILGEKKKQVVEIKKLYGMIKNYERDSVVFDAKIKKHNDKITKYQRYIDNVTDVVKALNLENTGLGETQKTMVKEMKDVYVKAVMMKKRMQNLKNDLKLKVGENSILEVQKQHISTQLDDIGDQENRVLDEIRTLDRFKRQLKKELRRCGIETVKLIRRKKKLLEMLEKEKGELNSKRLANESKKFKIDEVKTRKVVANGYLKIYKRRQHKLQTQLHVKDGEKRNLQVEITAFKKSNEESFRSFVNLQREYRQFHQQLKEASRKYVQSKAKENVQKMNIERLQFLIEKEEQKRRKELCLVESITFDRNLKRKEWKRLYDEIKRLEGSFVSYTSEIGRRREDTQKLEKVITDSEIEQQKKRRELEDLKVELSGIRSKIRKKRKMKKRSYQEVLKLKKIIFDTEVEKNRQFKELTAAVTDRDMLGIQLLRRNKELSELYQKMKVQQTELDRHSQIFNERKDRIALLSLKTSQLTKHYRIVSEKIDKYKTINQELKKLRDAVLFQKNKISALNCELDRKINVHSFWRSQEKESYIYLQKKEKLRGDIIKCRDKQARLDLEIQKYQRLYVELKKALKKQPGIEEASLIIHYKEVQKKQTKQQEVIKSELVNLRKQIELQMQKRKDIEREIEKEKKKWFNQALGKKKNGKIKKIKKTNSPRVKSPKLERIKLTN